MKFYKVREISLTDTVVVGFSVASYGIALSSIAIGGFLSNPEVTYNEPKFGWNCLLTGWFFYPLTWLANPVMMAGMVLLILRYRIAAFLLAMLAAGLAWWWTRQFLHEFPPFLLLAGYDWWIISMRVFAAGTLGSLIIHYSETGQTLRSLWQSSLANGGRMKP